MYSLLCLGRDSSVGVATRYGLDGSGIESRWGEIFCVGPDRVVGAELFHVDRQTDGQTDGQTDMTKLVAPFRNSVNRLFLLEPSVFSARLVRR